MTKKTLTPAQKAKLRKASREYPERYFVELRGPVRGSRWITAGSRYRAQCVRQYEKDCRPNPSRVRDVDIAKYVSASAPTHAIDGWSFVGRAVDAALRGDSASAVFFAYYAELRAAMSLLAAEGFGVLNTRGPILFQNGKTETLASHGTHDVSWLALNHWSGLNRSSKLISSLISPQDIPLSVWLEKLAPSVSMAAISDRWLGLWGIDLRAVGDDHLLRNGSSYRPSQFRRSQRLDAVATLGIIRDLWRLVEPSRGVRFPNLAKLLLRRALRAAQVTAVTSTALSFTGMTGAEAHDWASFLSGPEDSLALLNAANVSELGSDTCHVEVICRAVLLLTVATEASRKLMAAGELTESELRFWWAQQGIERGLWSADSVPEDPLDAWSDVAVALDASADWQTSFQGVPTLSAMRSGIPQSICVLGGFEAAGIWGLVP